MSELEIDEIQTSIFRIAKIKIPSKISKEAIIKALTVIESQLQKNEREFNEQENRLSNILNVITSLAMLEYDKKATISNRKDHFDALALGVNMLGEELQASTISLNEKEVLLKEVHHRVKNNLQVISSLLNLQAERITDAYALEKFRESQNRVRSMALVHEKIYESQNLSKVNFAEYINKFIEIVFYNYDIKKEQVVMHINFEVEDCQLPIDIAIPCALILNELVSNAFKYAFPAQKKGNLYLKFYKAEKEQCVIEVADDGVGMPPSFNINKLNSLGLQLVDMLVKQIGGKLCIENQKQGGARFVISFNQIK